MTSYHSGLIKIYLPLSPPPSFPCRWQINTKLNKHVLCQLMSNTNLTALDKHKHTHTHLRVFNSYIIFLLYAVVCVYIHIINMKICLDTKNLELFIFSK